MYISELSRSIVEMNAEILGRFKNCEAVVRPYMVALMERIVTVFVKLASLVPNLGEKGKLTLAGDMAQLEHAVGPLQYGAGVRVSDLGTSYRALRSLRPLLFLELNQIQNSPAVGETLSIPIVLHHLISRGPPNLQQPYVLQNEHIQVYCAWQESHTEEECVQLINQSLAAYVDDIKCRGETTFCPEYNVLKQLVDKYFKGRSAA